MTNTFTQSLLLATNSVRLLVVNNANILRRFIRNNEMQLINENRVGLLATVAENGKPRIRVWQVMESFFQHLIK